MGPLELVEGPLVVLELMVGPLVVLGVALVGPLVVLDVEATTGDILNWKSRLK